jgi:AcrR family transcriptional regulator
MWMPTADRREREKEALRQSIVEAARDIVAEDGLDALSMRAIADRIEYSPGTIYLYFRDKEEILREVIAAGFERMNEAAGEEIARLEAGAGPLEHYRALGRAYARFALESTPFFRAMFEVPPVPCEDGPEPRTEAGPMGHERVIATLQDSIDAGLIDFGDARRAAAIGWALVHGLSTLYLTGHLHDVAPDREAFLELLEGAMDSLGRGWRSDRPAAETSSPPAA